MKKRNLCPRRKRMNRAGRLQSARHWMSSYAGKNLVRGYARQFGVDLLCAALELRSMGVAIDDARIEQLRRLQAVRAEARRKRREEADRASAPDDRDDTFAFIAGYTAAGMPFGITWEETGVAHADDCAWSDVPF
jgi:hypothetical protein